MSMNFIITVAIGYSPLLKVCSCVNDTYLYYYGSMNIIGQQSGVH